MKAYVKPSCSFVELRTEENLASTASTQISSSTEVFTTLTENWQNNLGQTWENLNGLFKNKGK